MVDKMAGRVTSSHLSPFSLADHVPFTYYDFGSTAGGFSCHNSQRKQRTLSVDSQGKIWKKNKTEKKIWNFFLFAIKK